MKKHVIPVLLALMLVLALPLPALGEITSREQLNAPGIRIGVSTGSITESIVRQELPEAEMVSYSDKFLGYADVAAGKIDAFSYDLKQMNLAIQNGLKGVRLLEETLDTPVRIAVGISQVSEIPDLEERLNRFIAEIRENGTLQDMYDRWMTNAEEAMPEIVLPSAPEYTLTVGTTGNVPPYSFYAGAELSGYDIELARRFAAWLNAELKFVVFNFDAVPTAIQSGRVDCVMSNLQISPERKESFLFSDTLFEEAQGLMVRDSGGAASPVSGQTGSGNADQKEEPAADGGFWSSVRSSFEKTFVREGRWRLFVQGIANTLIITVLSLMLGTLLGFCVFMLCRKGNPVANGVTRFAMGLIQGMPMVVLLLFLYYVVFGRVVVGGIFVAVIAFTLTFGAAVFGLLRVGVGAVDRGQYEAAYALGYTDRRTFFRIILPQALPHVLPPWRGEIISLIKATSIVGYITVQDLTKVADIVRSRTYEAFFPLIAITVIYFLLEGLVIFLIGRATLFLDPKHRRRGDILKGVKTDD